MTRVQINKNFSRDIHRFLNPSWILRLSWTSRGDLRSEETQIQNHIRHFEGFITPEPFTAKVSNFESEALNNSSQNLCLPFICSTILPMLNTWNALALKRVVIHGSRLPGMLSQLTSSSDHWRYNKSNTCRSCSYNHPSISPPRQHSCQVHMILFHLREGDWSLL